MFRQPYHAVYETLEETILRGELDQPTFRDRMHDINTDELIPPRYGLDEYTTENSPYLFNANTQNIKRI